MAEYCHNSCSKCPPFARSHARRRPSHSSTALSMTVWSMSWQTHIKRCFSSQHLFRQVALLTQRGRAMLRVCQQLASTVHNVEQSFLLVTYATDLSLREIKCCSVVFGVTLKLLVINISPSFLAINKHRRLLQAISINLRHGSRTASY